jgi:hypothetical protein
MSPKKQKILIDLEKLNRLNAEGCPVCKRKFTLGETVVIAYGPWQGAKYIHENEAVFDKTTSIYYELKEGAIMYDKKELCEKIRELYPDIGECGIDVDVDYDEAQKSWTVNLKKDQIQLKHFLEDQDAELCMEGKQCMSLGLEIAQLKDNIAKI